MKNIIFFLFLSTVCTQLFAQNSITIKVISEDKKVLPAASVILKKHNIGSSTNAEGLATLSGIPNGEDTLVVSFVGFETVIKRIKFPTTEHKITINMHEEEESLEEVIVQTTRTKRSIASTPTRTEVITAEELGEKAMMNSANIAMVLKESTGIQMQQTSANSANKSIRIQGLDGRFTQLLKDGFPLFSGFSSGLSIMQIPPLDLKQIEIIKGSSSTLYGGGAIAGLVNLISKQPKDRPELNFMYDKTSRGGNTLNAFYSQRLNKFGISVYASGNLQKPIDLNDDHFTDIPEVKSVSFNPSFFFYFKDNTSLRVSLSASAETRNGGDMDVLNNKASQKHSFFEKNKSARYSSRITYNKEISSEKFFTVKQSISYFSRHLSALNHEFKGNQIDSFSEGTYSVYKTKTDWIFGANVITENFKEHKTSILDRSYTQFTAGVFAQNNYKLNNTFTLESGLRLDYNDNHGPFVLPRVSMLIKYNNKISSRVGGGFGYKIPTIFTEDAQLRSFKNILPIRAKNFHPETSVGINADVNYKTHIFNDKVFLSFNQLVFYTQLKNSLILQKNEKNYAFINAKKPLNSFGLETNLKIKYKDFILFANYAFNDVKINGKQKTLTPKHNIGAVLMYEVHHKWRIGYEAYYKSRQLRNNLTTTPDFWTMGIMAMRTFGKFSIYINFENFTDIKQQNYQSMVIMPHNNPTFTDIWAPTDGFVCNGGILIKL